MILWFLTLTCVVGLIKKVDLYSAFAEGAKEGLLNAIHILPHLSAALVAIHILRGSGLLERLYAYLTPFMQTIGLVPGVTPLFFIRPLSGSAALAVLTDILHQYGPDSRTGLLASTMMGSGETVLYTCALYLAAAGVKKSRYIIPVSLVAWLVGCCVSGLFFR